MPPKAAASSGKAASARQSSTRKNASSASAGAAGDFKAEDVLQAVLLADSFQVKFRPLTQQKPKVLLPLINIPMIEYSLEFLVSGGVGELFVFCSSHASEVQAYLDASPWKRRKGLVIRTICADNCHSYGDALRFLDTLDVIKNDFVLISGDVISNVRLDSVVKEHKARVALDKRNMMTLLFKQAAQTHRTRPLADDAVLAIDPTTQQLLQYDNARGERSVHLAKQLLLDSRNPIQLRYDLMDAHISICTPEVLLLFQDNFDWQTFHGDFLTGVLGSEILGNKLFVHTMRRDEYAARCSDLRCYDAVSKDLMNRWAYPLVPDNNLLGGANATSFKYLRGNIYKEDGVSVSREASLGSDTAIGAGTVVGARSFVDKSVLGRDCRIGNNVRITGSYLWNNVTIEDDVVLDRAILADGCIVRAGSRIEHGAILSFNVVIGPNFVVAPYTRITTTRSDDDELGAEGSDDDSEKDEEEEEAEKEAESTPKRKGSPAATSGDDESVGDWDEEEVGMGGVGRVYRGADDEEEEEDEEDEEEQTTVVAGSAPARPQFKQSELNSIAPNPVAVAAYQSKARPAGEESEDEWDEIGEGADGDGDDVDAEDDPTLANQVMGGMGTNLHFFKFATEVGETLKRGHDESLPLDDISLEMSGLKFSHNTNVEEFAHATFLALFALLFDQFNPAPKRAAGPPFVSLDPAVNKGVMQPLGLLLKKWHPVLAKFANLEADQVRMIAGLEQACMASGFVATVGAPPQPSGATADTSVYTPLFTTVLRLMYEMFDVFSESAILEWAEQVKASLPDGEEGEHPLIKQAAQFLEWLDEADEEDEDEEDEDEE